MPWIFIAIASPALYGLANVIDTYFVNRLFKNVWVLIFFTSFFRVIFLPLIFLVEQPASLPLSVLPALLAISAIDVLYLYPYYKALESDDTSNVSALFALGKIFVPILAFVFLGEVLRPIQYAGFFIIIFASVALTIERGEKVRYNPSLVWMFLCSLLLAGESILYKYTFTEVSWSTSFFWSSVIGLVFAAIPLASLRYRRAVRAEAGSIRKFAPLITLEEFFTFGGSATSSLAVSLAPVTLVEGIDALQPFFVLLYALLFGRFFARVFKERTDPWAVAKKTALFVIMALGAVLVVR